MMTPAHHLVAGQPLQQDRIHWGVLCTNTRCPGVLNVEISRFRVGLHISG